MADSSTTDPLKLLASRDYLRLLVIAGVLGIPLSVLAYFFLAFVNHAQVWLYTTLPKDLGFDSEPTWWPLPLLALCGALVALTITRLPGGGGHSPVDGFKMGGGPTKPAALPGIVIAAALTLSLGAVLGPEAPLIALGSGLAVWLVQLVKRDVPEKALAVIGAAGSFAAISTLLGSPIVGAFLLMEAVGLGGATLTAVLLPGLLASGLGALVFVGLDSWTGLGTFSLTIPDVPYFGHPTFGDILWAIAIGVGAAVLGSGIRRLGRTLRGRAQRRPVAYTTGLGLGIAALAILFGQITGHSSSDVLFSGQDFLPKLVQGSASYSGGALALLVACKALAYGMSLSSFRGGPIFPAILIGAAAGIALSHLPGLELVPGLAIGMGAMVAVMLKLPMTSVMLPALLLGPDGLAVTPVVIVAVVVAYVLSTRLDLLREQTTSAP